MQPCYILLLHTYIRTPSMQRLATKASGTWRLRCATAHRPPPTTTTLLLPPPPPQELAQARAGQAQAIAMAGSGSGSATGGDGRHWRPAVAGRAGMLAGRRSGRWCGWCGGGGRDTQQRHDAPLWRLWLLALAGAGWPRLLLVVLRVGLRSPRRDRPRLASLYTAPMGLHRWKHSAALPRIRILNEAASRHGRSLSLALSLPLSLPLLVPSRPRLAPLPLPLPPATHAAISPPIPIPPSPPIPSLALSLLVLRAPSAPE